jgi:hypothetical protein
MSMSEEFHSGRGPRLAPLHVSLCFLLVIAVFLTSCTQYDPALSWKRAFCRDALRTTGAFLDVITGHATFGHPTELPQLVGRLNQEIEHLGTAATEGHKAFVSSVNLAMEELSLAKSWTHPRDPHLISARIELAQLGESLRLSPHEICPTARPLQE